MYLILPCNAYVTVTFSCQATETLFRMAVTRGIVKPIKHGEVRLKGGLDELKVNGPKQWGLRV